MMPLQSDLIDAVPVQSHSFNKGFAYLSALLVLMAGWSAELGAVGYRLPNQDPEGIARGNAFVAAVDNPSAIYYNPAAITKLEGHQVSIAPYLISAGVEYVSESGEEADTDSRFQLVPQLHYVFSPKKSRFSFGFGAYAPYGLGVDYGEDAPFNTLGIESDLSYLSFNSVVAYQVNPKLSVAAGLTTNYSEISLRQAIGIEPGDSISFDGDAFDIGYTLGLHYTINERWSLGAKYRSETQLDYEGTSIATSSPFNSGPVATGTRFVFPQFVDLGVAFQPNASWLIEVNLDWTDWNAVDASTLTGTGLGDVTLTLNYESSFLYEVGARKRLRNGLELSFGYVFSENSAPDETFTPLNPDSNVQLGSIGIAKRGERIGWSFAYHFAFNDSRVVSGNENFSLTGQTVDGDYRTLNHAFNLGIRFKF